MIEVVRTSLTRAGLAEQASFIHGNSHQVEILERADVVICDQVGFFGFDYGIVQTLQDARLRFLKPGGRLIPARINLQVTGVESDRCAALADDWLAEGIPAEFHWLRDRAVNTKHPVDLRPEELLCEPVCMTEIDFRQANPDYFSCSAQLSVRRDGVIHGLGGWFECELTDGVWMTNSPLSGQKINRSQAFLPIGEATRVKAGDVLQVTVMARPADHLIAWIVEVPHRRKFSHSTWLGDLLTPAEILNRNPDQIPKPSRTGRARSIVLSYCDGKRTFKQIGETVLREHPALFPSTEETTRFVAAVLAKDTT
jgi:protein arginine N-methyltransferase 1